MPRKAFIADLQKAADGASVAGISNVQPGGDDGEFTFDCTTNGASYEISAMIPDVSEYPSSHDCMLFGSDSAPKSVADLLSSLSGSATGKSIDQILELISRRLLSTDRDGDLEMVDSQACGDEFEAEDDDSISEDGYFPGDDDDDNDNDDEFMRPTVRQVGMGEGYTEPTSAFRARIRSDLMTAKANGFKVGHLGGTLDGLGCYISLSCRISKLGISEEAMQAWQIGPTEYLVAIFYYPNGYKSMDSFRNYDHHQAQRNIEIRIGISKTYKPTIHEAVLAFTTLSKEDEKRREQESQGDSQENPYAGFRNSFISRPLNDMIKERFTTLLKYRYNGMPWGGAEEFYNDHLTATHEHANLGLADKYLAREASSSELSPLVTSDHIVESMTEQHSLPLIGMQFVLRHFVRCTEFCLICFTKLPDDLQAIKPYVCDKPLCLYQYMSLGFGPSIEHEILSQPKVVDLLISLCYTTSRLGKLKDFPTGLSLLVPPSEAFEGHYSNQQQSPYPAYPQNHALPPPPSALSEAPRAMRWNAATKEIIFDEPESKCPVKSGDWIIMRTKDDATTPLHCRIVDTDFYPTIRTAVPITSPKLIPDPSAAPHYHNSYGYKNAKSTGTKVSPQAESVIAPKNEFREATFHVYHENFDELDEYRKRQSIFGLLDLLPSVEQMRQYLKRKTQSSLSSWVDRLPPAALGVLRWIIASNRACIVQVDDETGNDEDRVYGMSDWMQFRFAMGAPDKERRFGRAVRETTERLSLKYPTLFAYHGSPIVNWHSIIREGLHFKDTAHGRAYGHGVYHSLDINTSLGYSGYGSGGCFWAQSALKVTSALALNEIVNAPKDFVSSSPHLVVAQLDWIQTRYLFVKGANEPTTTSNAKESKPLERIEQDPSWTPKGSDKLIIPSQAISSSRRSKSRSTILGKRQKATGKSFHDPIELDDDDDDANSVATLEEDLLILRDEDVIVPVAQDTLPTPTSTKGKGKASGGFLSKLMGSKSTIAPKSLTDFVPGTLNYSTLPVLQPPAWATSGATKRLQQDFRLLLKVQEKEPMHELGWYIDAEHISNMYQWIIELHSFDPTLPLAKDMKSKNLKSIVLELRFGKEYPMSPPFVRVIRPRFLGFQQGGGGHVTAGGALCMELLTNNGWSAVSSIESVLLQVRMAMSSLDPKPARLAPGPVSDYGVGEAVEAYIRSCNVHGWQVPAGFREMAYGGTVAGGSQGYY